MIVKEHNKYGKKILAICDTNILGKQFEEGDAFLDLNSPFYKGKEMNKGKLIVLLKEFHHIMFAGKESVDLAKEQGIAKEEDIKTIDGVPYTMYYDQNRV
jgi:uncharacterized protein